MLATGRRCSRMSEWYCPEPVRDVNPNVVPSFSVGIVDRNGLHYQPENNLWRWKRLHGSISWCPACSRRSDPGRAEQEHSGGDLTVLLVCQCPTLSPRILACSGIRPALIAVHKALSSASLSLASSA